MTDIVQQTKDAMASAPPPLKPPAICLRASLLAPLLSRKTEPPAPWSSFGVKCARCGDWIITEGHPLFKLASVGTSAMQNMIELWMDTAELLGKEAAKLDERKESHE